MRKLLIIILFVCSLQNVFATNYYVSNSGNDANTGTSAIQAWQTIAKVNAMQSSFVAGDAIFFKRGDTFYGQLNTTGSTRGIRYDAYGTGADPKPVITGLTDITSWTNISGNIWESTSSVASFNVLRTVAIGGKMIAMGRTPNIQSDGFRPSYYTIQSHTTTSVTSSSLTGTPDYTGADVVIRMGNYIWEKQPITSQSTSTINYSGTTNSPTDGNGFFIQNSLATLDAQNEWYYNPTTKKLSVYSVGTPTDVKVATIDTLFFSDGKNSTIVNGLDFEGANTSAIVFTHSDSCTVSNCDFQFVGNIAIDPQHNTDYFMADGNYFHNIGNMAIQGSDGQNITVSNNTAINVGLIFSIETAVDNNSGFVFSSNQANATYYHNVIDSFQRKGISFRKSNSTVSYNYITNGALIRQDAGAIYTGFENETGKKIHHNIIKDMWGNSDGLSSTAKSANGIYLDDYSDSVEAYDNTIINVQSAGIFVHNGYGNNIHDNTIIRHSLSRSFTKGGLMFQTDNSMQAHPTRNNKFMNNIVIPDSTGSATYAIFNYNNVSSADALLFGTSDSNYYYKPNFFISSTAYIFSGWKTYTSQDANSQQVADSESVVSVYNPSMSDSTVALSAVYNDLTGTVYNGSVTLAPFESKILIYKEALPPQLPYIKVHNKIIPINLN